MFKWPFMGHLNNLWPFKGDRRADVALSKNDFDTTLQDCTTNCVHHLKVDTSDLVAARYAKNGVILFMGHSDADAQMSTAVK